MKSSLRILLLGFVSGMFLPAISFASIQTFDDLVADNYGPTLSLDELTFQSENGMWLAITNAASDGLGTANSLPNKLSLVGQEIPAATQRSGLTVRFKVPAKAVDFSLTGTFYDMTIKAFDSQNNLLAMVVDAHHKEDPLTSGGASIGVDSDKEIRQVRIASPQPSSAGIAKLFIQSAKYDPFSIDDVCYQIDADYTAPLVTFEYPGYSFEVVSPDLGSHTGSPRGVYDSQGNFYFPSDLAGEPGAVISRRTPTGATERFMRLNPAYHLRDLAFDPWQGNLTLVLQALGCPPVGAPALALVRVMGFEAEPSSEPVATPTITPPGGRFASSTGVVLATTTTGADIRYTLDGSTPTELSLLYTGPVPVTASATLNAKGFKTGSPESAIAGAVFEIQPSAFGVIQISRAGSPNNRASVIGAPPALMGVTELMQVITIPGSSTSNKSGGWTISSVTPTEIYAWSAPNWLEYSVDFGQGGTSSFSVTAKNNNNASAPGLPSGYAFNLTVWVDGVSQGTLLVPGSTTTYLTGSLDVTVPAGVHAVRFTWTNDIFVSGQYDSNIRVQSVSFTTSDTPPPTVVATPVISPNGGTFTSSVSVTLSTSTSGAAIRYTLDGSTPTATSALYSSPIQLTTSATLKAKGFASGLTESDTATAVFTINPPPPGGGTTVKTAIETSAASSGWTTSGTERYTWSAGRWLEYSFDFGSGGDWTLGVTAKNENTPSAPGLPPGYSFLLDVHVDGVFRGTLAVPGSTTSYQTGTMVVSMASGVHTVRFTWTNDAYASGQYDANIRIQSVSFTAPQTPPPSTVATPVMSPNGGTFTNSVTVTLSTSTAGATIRYTTNGSDPTASSTAYVNPIVINTTTTLKARAFLSGMADSAIASALFTIQPPGSSVTAPGANTSNKSSGGWNVIGTEIYAWGNPSWIEYMVDFGAGGNCAFSVTATNNTNPSAPGLPSGYSYNLTVQVDGVTKGTLFVQGSTVTYLTGSLSTTVGSGVHTVRFTWTNDAWSSGVYDANIRVKEVTFSPANAVINTALLPRIMPAGDSITRGNSDPNLFGYRDHLISGLSLGTHNFVGTFKSPASDYIFDVDHEGLGGDRTDQLEARMAYALSTTMATPNPAGSAVLIHIGTNDLGQGVAQSTAIGNIADIIDLIDSHDPAINVYVALLVPNTNAADDADITSFNTALAAEVAGLQASKNNLYLVNMNSAFKQNPNWQTAYFADEVHPNDAGYQLMADEWQESIDLHQ